MFKTAKSKVRLRVITSVAVVGLAAMGLSACASPSTTASSGKGKAIKADLIWWGWTPQPIAATQYIAEFNKTYPNVKVTYKQVTIDGWNAALRPALASSSGPDIYGINPGVRMDDFAGFAEDLAPAMKTALGSDWKSKLAPASVTGLSKAGKLAAVSVGSTYAGSVWINQSLFTKYNVTPPKTVAQWEKACAVFATNGVTCFVQGAAQTAFNRDTLQAITDSLEPGLWVKAEKGEAKWTSPNIVKALTVWKKFFNNGIMQKGALGIQQYPDANNAFMSGKAAMVMMGTWYMQYATNKAMVPAISAAGVADPKAFPIIPIPFPSATDKPASGFSLYGDSDYGLAVNKKSRNKEAATDFAVWLGTNEAGQQQVADVLNDIASLNGVTPDWANIPMPSAADQKPAVQALIDAAGTSKLPRLALVGNDLGTAIGVASTTVAEGQVSPDQAAKTLQSSAEAAGIAFK